MNDIFTSERELSLTKISTVMDQDSLRVFRQNMAQLRRLMTYYRCAMMEVETKFKVLNEQFSLENDHNHIESIRTRLKSMDSIIGKLHRRGLPLSVDSIEENLNDVAGVRVICPFVDDIYVLVDCLLRQDDVELTQIKDYIKHPKANGYRSLHLIVTTPIFLQDETRRMRVEVQLRTIAMDFWASLEHQLRYKKDIPSAIAAKLSRDLEECADISAMLDQRMQDIKNSLDIGA
ncbi:MAG: GTP pyrophosphokinase family protein [Faecousia sp.]